MNKENKKQVKKKKKFDYGLLFKRIFVWILLISLLVGMSSWIFFLF